MVIFPLHLGQFSFVFEAILQLMQACIFIELPLSATAKGASKVSKHLAILENTGLIDFTGVNASPATLKEYNTQINTVLQFVQAHGANLPVNQANAIRRCCG